MDETAPTVPPTGGAFNVDRAAEYCGVGRSTLYGLFRSGDIRPLKVGRRTVVARSELDAFLARTATEQRSA